MGDRLLEKRVQRTVVAFVFGGDICRTDDPNHLGLGWRSVTGTEADYAGACPSYERCLAVPWLIKTNPRILIVPSGGTTNLPESTGKSPPISTVMAAEMRALGVPDENIIEEPQAFNTEQQLLFCAAMARGNGWRGKDCAIVTMKWQFGRIMAMQHALRGQVRPFNLRTGFLSVERILEADDPVRWKPYFGELNATAAMRDRVLKEAAGIGQLLTGHPKAYRDWPDPLRV